MRETGLRSLCGCGSWRNLTRSETRVPVCPPRASPRHMDCGGKRSATPFWLHLAAGDSSKHNVILNPKRRRASLAAAVHMCKIDGVNVRFVFVVALAFAVA